MFLIEMDPSDLKLFFSYGCDMTREHGSHYQSENAQKQEDKINQVSSEECMLHRNRKKWARDGWPDRAHNTDHDLYYVLVLEVMEDDNKLKANLAETVCRAKRSTVGRRGHDENKNSTYYARR